MHLFISELCEIKKSRPASLSMCAYLLCGFCCLYLTDLVNFNKFHERGDDGLSLFWGGV